MLASKAGRRAIAVRATGIGLAVGLGVAGILLAALAAELILPGPDVKTHSPSELVGVALLGVGMLGAFAVRARTRSLDPQQLDRQRFWALAALLKNHRNLNI